MNDLLLTKQDQVILESILRRKHYYEKAFNIKLTDDIIKQSFILEKQMIKELYK